MCVNDTVPSPRSPKRLLSKIFPIKIPSQEHHTMLYLNTVTKQGNIYKPVSSTLHNILRYPRRPSWFQILSWALRFQMLLSMNNCLDLRPLKPAGKIIIIKPVYVGIYTSRSSVSQQLNGMVTGLSMKSNEHFQNLFFSYVHCKTHFCLTTAEFNFEFSDCNAMPSTAVQSPHCQAALLIHVDYSHLVSTFTALNSPRLEIGPAHPLFNVSYKK